MLELHVDELQRIGQADGGERAEHGSGHPWRQDIFWVASATSRMSLHAAEGRAVSASCPRTDISPAPTTTVYTAATARYDRSRSGA